MSSVPSPATERDPRPARTGLGPSLRLLAADIKLAHSVFALPFAILGAFLAGPAPGAERSEWWRFAGKLGLVVVCMVGARTWAMLVNRLADRRLDAENQRTAGRVLAAGRVSPAAAWGVATLAAGFFALGAWGFWWFFDNPWPAYLAAPVLGWLAFYSFTKRFTALCHVVLGISLAMSPLAAAIAVRPASVGSMPSLWWLAGFVALWVAGFDVVYALQDEAFDREKKLSSIPVVLGQTGAVWVARSWHVLAMIMLLAAWTSHASLGYVFAAGIATVGVLLAVEHGVLAWTARGVGKSPRLHVLFFTLNGVAGVVIGAIGVFDLLT